MTRFVCLFFILVFSALPGFAQQSASPAVAGGTVVPALVNFSGVLQDVDRKPLHGTIGVTFSLYREEQGGSPIWLETQNVQPDSAGHYTVQLGSMTKQGLPMDLFISGEAQWLGVQVQGHEEQPRIMLLSVPYALKAGDAQTLGGLPPSAFLVAPPVSHDASPSEQGNQAGEASGPSVGGSGTADYIPLWTDSQGTLGNSIVFQSGSGSSARLGINLKNPLATVDVNGQELVRGLFEMATTGIANQNKGFSSNPINLESSAFSSSTGKNTLNHFQWQAEPVGNNTSSPGASLNLLYGTDPAAPSETGLKVSSTGVFAFAAGQKFPGTGTVTSVGLSAPSSDFTVSGSPITKSGTLALNWSVAPTDADTVNAIVKRDANGGFSAGPISAAAGGQGGTYGVYGVGVELMKDGALLANAGHFDVEIDLDELRSLATGVQTVRPLVEQYRLGDGRRLNLLAHGRVVNLAAAEGHPAAVMDVSFALQALSVEELVLRRGELAPGVLPVPASIDREVARLKLAALGVEIDEPTPDQTHYRESWT